MFKFQEELLVQCLAKFSAKQKSAFATACATRLFSSYAAYAFKFGRAEDVTSLRGILDELWSQSLSSTDVGDRHRLEEIVQELSCQLPSQEETWTVLHAFADDAIASTMYAARTLLTASANEAAWAARRAYEAVDQAVLKLSGTPNTPDEELLVISHPLIQRELGRQNEDLRSLSDLGANAILQIKERAFLSHMFSDKEFSLLAGADNWA
jgi:Protein of unknown function (DUF416)